MQDVTQYPRERYVAIRSAFRASVGDVVMTSHKAHAIDAGDRRYWSSVLLVRICAIGQSILRLCPDIEDTNENMQWDFSSVGSLTRNVFECVMFFRYFTEDVPECQWKCRLNLMRLHDCCERINVFSLIGSLKDHEGFETDAADLRNRLTTNDYFLTLEPKLQKQLLLGKRASIPTLRQMVSSYTQDERIWFLYQMFSNHAHSMPFSFYRTTEHCRTGVENEVDRGYISMALEFGKELIDEAVALFRKDFASFVVFPAIGSPPPEIIYTRAIMRAGSNKAKMDRNAMCPCGSKQKFRWCHGMEA